MKSRQTTEEKYTLLDRFAVAFLSAALAIVTGILVWGVIAGFNIGGASIIILPFKIVLGFSIFMGVLGFFKLENYLVTIYGYIWSILSYVLGINPR